MDIKPQGAPLNVTDFFKLTPLLDHNPAALPKTMREVKHMQAMNNMDPNMSEEERERQIRLREYIENKDKRKKTPEQRAREKKLKKLSNISKRKNRR